MKTAKSVDDFIRNNQQWTGELQKLREILVSSQLVEEIKWGGPCYTYRGKNVVGLGAFKSYFGLWFYQGALLKDEHNLLINAQDGKTKALRQWRMTSAKHIKPALIKHYLKEAIANTDAGREIKADRGQPVNIPPQLQSALRRHEGAEAAFQALGKGLQREYAEYVASAKRDDTKRQRIEKVLPLILAGVGLNDKYRR